MAIRTYERVKNHKGNPNNPFADFKPVILYDYHEIDKLVEELNGKGYECYNIDEGCLGSGDWICVPPDERHYYFLIWEVAMNSQSSMHKVRCCSKLSKKNQMILDEFKKGEPI